MADTVELMSVEEAVAAVRSATAHDNDNQVTDTQIAAELDREYRTLRRFLTQTVPSMYQQVQQFTLVTTDTKITKPVDFDRLVRLEVQFSQGYWEPLDKRPPLHVGQGVQVDVSGTYRLTYVARPVDGYTAFDLPDGADRILVNYVAAWVRRRFEEDPTYERTIADQMKAELRRELVMRDGAHTNSLLNHNSTGYGFRSYYEEGDHFVIM